MGERDVYPTVEVRWFCRGMVPRSVLEWFLVGGSDPCAPASRTDYYLRLSDGDALGIKLREGRIEIKQRQRGYGVRRLHQRVAGQVEGWGKWSFALAGADSGVVGGVGSDPAWVGVKKERRLWVYQLTADQEVIAIPAGVNPAQGCGVELTQVTVGEQVWWSLGFEAFGAESTLQDGLLRIARYVLSASEPPALDARNSCSYPQWLATLPTATSPA
jgi:hypothetical protein